MHKIVANTTESGRKRQHIRMLDAVPAFLKFIPKVYRIRFNVCCDCRLNKKHSVNEATQRF